MNSREIDGMELTVAERLSRMCARIPLPLTAALFWMLAISVFAGASPNVNRATPPATRARLTANPAEVQISGDSGTTRIIWDTGNGGAGRVYVLPDDGPEALFARGPKGEANAVWIHAGHSYVFKLLAGTDGSSVVATVTVRGVKLGLPRSIRWLIALAVVAFFYFGAMYGAPRGKAPPPGQEATAALGRINIARNLIMGLAAFLLLDAALFHSSLYSSILLPDSIMGHVHWGVEDEKHRVPSGRKEILVLGDSRLVEGFSERLADDLTTDSAYKFINFAVKGTTPFIWFYVLRELDPGLERYDAIVIPVAYRDRDAAVGYESIDRAGDFHSVAPLLRYADAFSLPAGFPRWNSKCRSFAAALLRGYGFQPDILDLLEHPFVRFEQLKREIKEQRAQAARFYEGHKESLAGIRYDQAAAQVVLPHYLDPPAVGSIKLILDPKPRWEIDQWLAYRKRWIGGILQRYATSRTKVILVQLPRGPIVRLHHAPEDKRAPIVSLIKNDRTILLDENLFLDLEKPEYFVDGYHVNAVGRERLTKRLVSEVMRHLSTESARSPR